MSDPPRPAQADGDVLAAIASERARVAEFAGVPPESTRLPAGSAAAAVSAAWLDAVAAELAPGPLSAGWHEAEAWRSAPDSDVGPPTAVRVGSYHVGSRRIPALLPLFGLAQWWWAGEADQFGPLADGVVLRLVAALGPHRLRILGYDPDGRLALGRWAALRAGDGDAVRVARDETTFARELDRVLAGTQRAVDDLDLHGFGSLTDMHQVRGEPAHPYRLIIVDAALVGDPVTARLRRLSEHSRGVTAALLRGVPAAPADPHRMELTAEGHGATSSLSPGVHWCPDTTVPEGLVDAIAASVADLPRPAGAPPGVETLTAERTDQLPGGLRALIGRHDGRPVYLDLRSGTPAMAHGLVGGAPGQGRTNALLLVMHLLAAGEHSEDLDLVAVGVGSAAEFAVLAAGEDTTGWLPHLSAVGWQAEPEAVVSLLRDQVRDLRQRRVAVDSAATSTIDGDGGRPPASFPRRLLVIDGVEALLTDASAATEAVGLLTTIAREGGDVGLHLLLAACTTGPGAVSLPAELAAVLPHRIAVYERGAAGPTLGANNHAAEGATRPGRAVVNAHFGEPSANVEAVLGWVGPAAGARLRRQLWNASTPSTPPVRVCRPAEQ